MGLVIIVEAVLAILITGVPAVVLGILVTRRSVLSKEFTINCVFTTFFVAVLQYSFASGILLGYPSNHYLIPCLAPLWGWHLLPPVVIASVIWCLTNRTSPIRGVAAGLFFSIVLLAVASLPLCLFLFLLGTGRKIKG